MSEPKRPTCNLDCYNYIGIKKDYEHLENKLRELFRKWRLQEEYQHGIDNPYWAYGVEACADELESLLEHH